MPESETIERARADKKAGKPATTQAGEFVREEMHQSRKENTAPGAGGRPLPSASPRRGVPGWTWSRPRKAHSVSFAAILCLNSERRRPSD